MLDQQAKKKEEQEKIDKFEFNENGMQKYFPDYRKQNYFEATAIDNGPSEITQYLNDLPEPPSALDDAKRMKKIR